MVMKITSFKKPVQLSLFDSVVLSSECLMATRSPRCAVYNIWLIREPGGYVVKKESGAAGKKMIPRVWRFGDLDQAEGFFQKKVQGKTNPGRKTRVYEKVSVVAKKAA